jgi:hypothetical protein
MVATNMAIYMAERRRKRRSLLIEMAGGKCVQCGSINDLHFDHKDPKQRLFRLNGKDLDGPWEAILEEWRKCQLLCRTCHLEKTKLDGVWKAWNKGIGKDGRLIPDHGDEIRYINGCRCDDCYVARRAARIRRGEISGARPQRRMKLILQKLYGEQRAVNT